MENEILLTFVRQSRRSMLSKLSTSWMRAGGDPFRLASHSLRTCKHWIYFEKGENAVQRSVVTVPPFNEYLSIHFERFCIRTS